MVEFGGVLKAAAPVKPMDKYIAQEIMTESQMTRWMLVDGWMLLTNAGIVVTKAKLLMTYPTTVP